jgi:glycine cleavage system H lipoate-binding protein
VVSTITDETTWKMVIGRDVLVPVINSKNPLLKFINEKGISAANMEKAFSQPGNMQWGTLLGKPEQVAANYYRTEDPAAAANIASWLRLNSLPEKGTVAGNEKEMLAAIQKDPNGLGFCSMKILLDPVTQKLPENICILPIDKNGSGKMEAFEKIYKDPQSFMHGVWVGKYPSQLCRNIYAVAKSQPSGAGEVALLTWILSSGQEYLNQKGYFDLLYAEREGKTGMLAGNGMITAAAEEPKPFRTAMIIILVILAAGIVSALIYRFLNRREAIISHSPEMGGMFFNERSVSAPKGLYFDKSHTWAFMEIDGNVRIGLDEFMQHITGPFTKIRMKTPGEVIRKGEKIFTVVQDGKQLSIHSPISGKIKAQNELLAGDISKINVSPYSEGWIYLIEPTNWIRETQFMVMADRYGEWLKHEFTRVKDFFASSFRAHSSDYVHLVLQDGGDLRDHILSDFGPEVWEDFQTKFIDTSN